MAKNTQYTKTNGYRVSQKTPWGHPVVYLLSDASTFTTGIDIIIDGGYQVW